jgi:mannose-6-phosphate isomerase-like protein (cupin superfamily)
MERCVQRTIKVCIMDGFIAHNDIISSERDSTMIILDVADSPRKKVIDGSLLCELLHPDKVPGAQRLRCSVAHAIVPPGVATLPHLLKNSTELYYILEGTGEMHIGTRSEPVHAGQIILIPRGRSQYIKNTGSGDLVFLCIVTPKWQAADEELVDCKPGKTVSAGMRAAAGEPAKRRPAKTVRTSGDTSPR